MKARDVRPTGDLRGPVLRELVGMIGPDGIKQPIAAVYPIERIKDAVAHARSGKKVLLAMHSGRLETMLDRS